MRGSFFGLIGAALCILSLGACENAEPSATKTEEPQPHDEPIAQQAFISSKSVADIEARLKARGAEVLRILQLTGGANRITAKEGPFVYSVLMSGCNATQSCSDFSFRSVFALRDPLSNEEFRYLTDLHFKIPGARIFYDFKDNAIYLEHFFTLRGGVREPEYFDLREAYWFQGLVPAFHTEFLRRINRDFTVATLSAIERESVSNSDPLLVEVNHEIGAGQDSSKLGKAIDANFDATFEGYVNRQLSRPTEFDEGTLLKKITGFSLKLSSADSDNEPASSDEKNYETKPGYILFEVIGEAFWRAREVLSSIFEMSFGIMGAIIGVLFAAVFGIFYVLSKAIDFDSAAYDPSGVGGAMLGLLMLLFNFVKVSLTTVFYISAIISMVLGVFWYIFSETIGQDVKEFEKNPVERVAN